jgi:hypothetical protein
MKPERSASQDELEGLHGIAVFKQAFGGRAEVL